jgi:hypothetical protein
MDLVTTVERLLPTPTSTGESDNRDIPKRIADGRQMHLSEIVRLLPTPTSRDHKGRNQRDDETCLPGVITALPSPDGSTSSDDPPPNRSTASDSLPDSSSG